jgi:hypothetical protein
VCRQSSAAEAIPAEAVVPTSPLSESDALDLALDTLVALTPLQYGGLAALGLSGWSSVGLSSWRLELMDVSTGLPWFHVIIAGTLFSRLTTPVLYQTTPQLCHACTAPTASDRAQGGARPGVQGRGQARGAIQFRLVDVCLRQEVVREG